MKIPVEGFFFSIAMSFIEYKNEILRTTYKRRKEAFEAVPMPKEFILAVNELKENFTRIFRGFNT